MRLSNISVYVLAALASPCVAQAGDFQFTPNVGVVSDYLVRGISQTSGRPALQGGIDMTHKSGAYLGVWGSNVSWITDTGATGTANLEVDTYAGYKNTYAGDYNYDLGYVRYNFLGSYQPAAGTAKADTHELYAALAYQWLSVKYSYSLGDFLTVRNARGTDYLEANVSYPLQTEGITLGAHYGRQTYKGADTNVLVAQNKNPSYSDYNLSATKDFSGYDLGLLYSATNATHPGFYTTVAGKNLARSTFQLSMKHAF